MLLEKGYLPLYNMESLGKPTDHLQLAYAKNFSIDYYDGGYKLLTTKDGTQVLTVPEGKEAPDNLDANICPVFLCFT